MLYRPKCYRDDQMSMNQLLATGNKPTNSGNKAYFQRVVSCCVSKLITTTALQEMAVHHQTYHQDSKLSKMVVHHWNSH